MCVLTSTKYARAVFYYVDLELRSETNWIHAQTHALVTNAFLSPAAESVLSRSEACMVLDVVDDDCTRYIYAYTGRCTKDARATCLSFIHMGNTRLKRLSTL